VDVLIVSKLRSVGDLVADVLGSAGYRCRMAGDAEEALEIFRQQRPALVVSDLRMPSMSTSGVDLLKQVRREDPYVAVVLLTGDLDGRAVAHCMKLGAHKVLAKPVHVDELMLTAERALERRQLLMERPQYRAVLESS
jgi:DNA-binding NtrC family response regulator